jgi:hypothetical protein
MIPLNITLGDGTDLTVDARPFAIELWERETKQKMFGMADGFGMSDLLRIAYHELKLSGETVGKYDEWAASVSSIMEEPDPKDDQPQARPGS